MPQFTSHITWVMMRMLWIKPNPPDFKFDTKLDRLFGAYVHIYRYPQTSFSWQAGNTVVVNVP